MDKPNMKQILQDLRATNLSKDKENQLKGVELLKGLSLSEDPKAEDFWKKLGPAINSIIDSMVGKEVNESTDYLKKASKFLNEN